MRIVVDLDGTICEVKQPGESYADVLPKPGAVDALKALYAEGHTVIVYTARHMQTCDHNVLEVIDRIGETTLEWLDRHEVPYSDVVFGKPLGDVYIDDRAVRFVTWENVLLELAGR